MYYKREFKFKNKLNILCYIFDPIESFRCVTIPFEHTHLNLLKKTSHVFLCEVKERLCMLEKRLCFECYPSFKRSSHPTHPYN